MMEYKGYIGKVDFDDEAGIFHGDVINTRDVITFQGETVADLRTSFRDSVEDYLAFCKDRGEAPDKPFSGQFVTRISPELHRQVSEAAAVAGKSLNGWVTEQLQAAVRRDETAKPAGKKSAAKAAKRKSQPARKSGR